MTTEVLTPPQLAVRWGVKADKVLALINSGELKAMNLATNAKGERPRWKIRLEDVRAFEDARSNKPPVAKPTGRRRREAATGKEYF